MLKLECGVRKSKVHHENGCRMIEKAPGNCSAGRSNGSRNAGIEVTADAGCKVRHRARL